MTKIKEVRHMRRRSFALLLLAALLAGVFMSCCVHTHLLHHICPGKSACPVCICAEAFRLGLAGLGITAFLSAARLALRTALPENGITLPVFFSLISRNTRMND